MTIKEAAISVLREADEPLTVDQIYDRIQAQSLFAFKAKQPKSVLSRQLRSHCTGVQLKLASEEKCFRLTEGKKYSLV